MAESQSRNSSSSATKEKKTMLDDEIGKEFLSSWKSMSVAEKDPMDFSFTMVSSGKRKPFNFGKLDLDFDLGDDFGKLSSFNVDMPDLDFATPPAMAANSKELSKPDSSNGTHQKNQDSITFSFDFNELDNFDLDSALNKGNVGAIKNPNQKTLDSDNILQQDLKLNQLGDAEATDNRQNKKLPLGENVMTSSAVNTVADVATGNLRDNVPSVSATIGDLVASHGNSLVKKIISSAEETDQHSGFAGKTKENEPCGDKILTQSPGGKDHNGGTVPDVQKELSSHDVESDTQHNSTGDATEVPQSDQANLLPKNLDPIPFVVQETHECGSEGIKSGTLTESCTGDKLAVDDTNYEPASAAILSLATTHGSEVNKDVHCSTANSFVPLRSGRNAGDDVTLPKGKELATGPSSCVLSSKVTERHECKSPSVGMEFSSLGGKGVAALHSSCHPRGRREGLHVDGFQKCSKLVVNLRTPDKELNKEDFVLQSTENNKIVHNASFEVSPTCSITKPNKLDRQTSSNPSTGLSSMGLIHNAKLVSTEGGLGTRRKAPDLSSLKISRSIDAIKDKSQAEIRSDFQRNSKINMEGQAHALSKCVHAVVQAERKIPVIPSLKRKVIEAPTLKALKEDAEAFTPHKRLSPAPSDCRFHLVFGSTVENLVCNQDNPSESKHNSVIYDHPTSGTKTPFEETIKELEITPASDDDDYVEKAAAYSKELDNICILLKKKHEEAKEMLVRAIVNNNSLLMLNHPMFDEKIHMVQQFAARLMSNKHC